MSFGVTRTDHLLELILSFVPGRSTHRDNTLIVPVADDVAQSKKADLGVCFGYYKLLLSCC